MGTRSGVPLTVRGSVCCRLRGGEAHAAERLQHAAHGALGERGIAGEARLHVVAGHHAKHQPRAGPGIAEIEAAQWAVQAADALASDLDDAIFPAHLGAKRRDGTGRGQDVVGLEQAGDAGPPRGQGAEDQRPVRDRLVARHPRAAGQGP